MLLFAHNRARSDSKDSSLYCAGVEPSAIGNAALARGVWPLIVRSNSDVNGAKNKSNDNDDDDDDDDDDDEVTANSE